MSIRTAAVLLLLAGCARHDATTPSAAQPVALADPPGSGPEPADGPPVATAPFATLAPPDSPAVIDLAIASVQISEDCPAAPGPAAEDRPGHDSAREGQRKINCDASSLQLGMTNTGGRPGKLHITQVRLLDGASKRVLGTLTSGTPSRWDIDRYQPWDEQVPGNTVTHATYRLGPPAWTNGQAVTLAGQPYFVEVVLSIDGRERTVRSAEVIPARDLDMIET